MWRTEVLETGLTGQHIDDEEAVLIARIAKGDRVALAELYERFQRPLFRYICQLTPDHSLAEEVLQDTLVAVWKGAGGFGGRSRVQTWLIGIARRQAHNRLRRHTPPITDLDSETGLPDSSPGPEAQVLTQFDHEALAAALQRLSPSHREALHLSFVQGLSYQEIADVLGIPQGTVKSRLANAKRALRALLSETEE